MQYDKLLFDRYFEDWSALPAERVCSLLRVKSKIILPDLKPQDLSKKLNIKFGIDPTGAEIHIGHLCPAVVMNIFVKIR